MSILNNINSIIDEVSVYVDKYAEREVSLNNVSNEIYRSCQLYNPDIIRSISFYIRVTTYIFDRSVNEWTLFSTFVVSHTFRSNQTPENIKNELDNIFPSSTDDIRVARILKLLTVDAYCPWDNVKPL